MHDFHVGDAIDLTITCHDADVGQLVPGINARPNPLLTNPDITGVALGNCNPANSVTFTVGSHTITLSDFACAINPDVCEAETGFDFHYGPTAISYRGQFTERLTLGREAADSKFGVMQGKTAAGSGRPRLPRQRSVDRRSRNLEHVREVAD